jgi:hypothetical protein
MNFLLADTFADSLTRLTTQEQKAVKTSVFDLQMDPSHPGLQMHRLENAKDPDFWSARVSRDIRLIIHRSGQSLLVCYVGHHDAAYAWAEKRKLTTHPKTGALQIVEIRELVQEIPVYVQAEIELPAEPPLFAGISEEVLLSYGVPPEWLDDVRKATESTLLDLAGHLPQEAAEALLELATGNEPQISKPTETTEGITHPDAQRRFRLIKDEKELALALEYPWEKWTVYLHPSQRTYAEKSYNGPARITGSAGTGKTIVALHRAAKLLRENPGSRVLLTTFSPALASLLELKLGRLLGKNSELLSRIDVKALDELATEAFEAKYPEVGYVENDRIAALIRHVLEKTDGHSFSENFLISEWKHVVDAWQIATLDDYLNVPRTGRKTRLGAKQREPLWEIMAGVKLAMAERNLTTTAGMYAALTADPVKSYDFAIVDEAQDLSVPQLRFLAALTAGKPDGLFLAGDIGQRIFQHPFSWKDLGLDVRGRSHTLRVNYRTSHAIRKQADKLLPEEIRDLEGETESRKGTVSLFNGPDPEVKIHGSKDAEIDFVSDLILERIERGFLEGEIGIFVRSEAQLPRARAALKKAGVQWAELERTRAPEPNRVALSTMHLAKGLEFRAVIVMACDDEIIPLQERVESITDEADLEEVYTTERHLLYVACTRARESLTITATSPESEFLADLS